MVKSMRDIEGQAPRGVSILSQARQTLSDLADAQKGRHSMVFGEGYPIILPITDCVDAAMAMMKYLEYTWSIHGCTVLEDCALQKSGAEARTKACLLIEYVSGKYWKKLYPKFVEKLKELGPNYVSDFSRLGDGDLVVLIKDTGKPDD